MEVFITTPNLDGIIQSGSGIVTTDYFISDHFNVTISGSGVIETAVDALDIDAVISGHLPSKQKSPVQAMLLKETNEFVTIQNSHL